MNTFYPPSFASRSPWGHTLPMVLQERPQECGLACLAMLSSFHGSRIYLAEIRAAASITERGLSLEGLIRIARLSGFIPRAIAIDARDFTQLKLPCILHLHYNHFVVLSDLIGSRVRIHDPAHGIRKISMGVLLRLHTGVALEVEPTSDIDISPRRGLWLDDT